jgi:hypothetical protein
VRYDEIADFGLIQSVMKSDSALSVEMEKQLEQRKLIEVEISQWLDLKNHP